MLPTAAGAYYALSRCEDSALRRLILALLRHDASPLATNESVAAWLGLSDVAASLAHLERAQALGLIQGFREVSKLPGVGVGDELHQLLPPLSSVGRALLVDWNGLALASCGLDVDAADALAALSADLIAVQLRHAARLAQHFGLDRHAWAAVDAFGSSRIGAWPLYVGAERLVLVLLGEPCLNQSEFLTLAWLLINRYG